MQLYILVGNNKITTCSSYLDPFTNLYLGIFIAGLVFLQTNIVKNNLCLLFEIILFIKYLVPARTPFEYFSPIPTHYVVVTPSTFYFPIYLPIPTYNITYYKCRTVSKM